MADSKRWTLICLSLSVAVVNTTFSLLAPIFPEVAAAKGITSTMVGVIFSGFSIVTVIGSPIIGEMLRRGYCTRIQCLMGGILVVGLSSAAFGMVTMIANPSNFVLVCIVLRLLLGLGCAAVDTSSTAAVVVLYADDAQLGSAMGLVEACLGFGWVIGPAAGGFLAQIGGFGAPFYVAAAATLVLGPLPVLLASQRLNASSHMHDEKHAAGVNVVMRLPGVQLVLVTAMLGAAALTWVDPTLEPYLQGHGYSVGYVGMAFALLSFTYAILAPSVGWVSDMYGPGHMLVIGCILTAVSYFLLGPAPMLHLPPAATLVVMFSLALMGVGSCMMFVPAMSAMVSVCQEALPSNAGIEDTLSGLLNSAYYMGGGVAPLLGGAVTDLAGFPLGCTYFGASLILHTVVLYLALQAFPSIMRGQSTAPADDEEALMHHTKQTLLSKDGLHAPGAYHAERLGASGGIPRRSPEDTGDTILAARGSVVAAGDAAGIRSAARQPASLSVSDAQVWANSASKKASNSSNRLR